MRKLSLELAGREAEQSPPAVFERQTTTSGRTRVTAWVPDGHADTLLQLSALLQAPYYVLYILHTPRGEGEPGRYQSTELTRGELDGLLMKYGPFFADDGRHDLWVYSPSTARTLVWDRHNKLFAEGEPLDDIIGRLLGQGFQEGALQPLGNHFHHYRAECDADAANLLREFDWHWTPLRPQDEQ
jgi:hypothetical protein